MRICIKCSKYLKKYLPHAKKPYIITNEKGRSSHNEQRRISTRDCKKAKVTQKEAAEILNGFVETVQKSVSKGEKVTLVGFGTFEARKRAARTGRNPQTGKEIKIAAKTVPAFTAGKKFKELVNKK